ncbi:MAG TPA: glycosyltransferase family 2 protein, partial [Burkholderiales bacterium]|nr:glycosyltransferase family 2 protein [Burkholderiales bacterium]
MPRFSILIPTRDRPATLRHTLASVASQPGEDYEIVVADNCSGPESRRIVEACGHPRIRYTRSDEILPMCDNWERGLSHCEGEYVTVLGDDDALVENALPHARRLLGMVDVELVSWSPHVYWWPDAIVPWNRNLLIVRTGRTPLWVDSRSALTDFYGGTLRLDELPMIYHAFFHRRLIDEASRRFGAFFRPREAAPDIASGILGLHLTGRFLYAGRPLSIRGNSGKSNGTAQWARSLGAEQRAVYFREERMGLEKMIHEALVPSPNLHIIVANAKLRCRELYFPDGEDLGPDLSALPLAMARDLNSDPESYEDNLRDARALAARLGRNLDPKSIPSKKKLGPPTWGPVSNEEGGLERI